MSDGPVQPVPANWSNVAPIIGLFSFFFALLTITPMLFVVPPSVKFVNTILPQVGLAVFNLDTTLVVQVFKIIIWTTLGVWAGLGVVWILYVLYKLYLFIVVAKT